jgi:hypothetical protein
MGMCGEEACSPHGGQEAEEKGNRRKVWMEIVLQDTPPVAYFLQLGPTSYLSPPPQNAIVF